MRLFILGASRSGTTLLHQILSTHTHLTGICETEILKKYHLKNSLNDLIADVALTETEYDLIVKFFESKKLNERSLTKWEVLDSYCEAHQHFFSTPGYVEKSPSHSYFIDGILQNIPDAKIIFILRDPRANIASKNYARHSRGRRRGFPATLQFLLNLSEITNINRYIEAKLRNTESNRLMLIHYEQLVGNTESTMRKITNFSELPFEPSYKSIDPKDIRMSAWGSAGKKNSSFVRDPNGKDDGSGRDVVSSYVESNTVSSDSLNHWEQRLTKAQVTIVEKVISQICPAISTHYGFTRRLNPTEKGLIFIFKLLAILDFRLFLYRNYRVFK